jgi:hypothetical protein
MGYNVCTPIPGGSTYRVGFDEEFIEVHLPPVGYAIDRVPDPATGIPSMELVKCEILFEDLKITKQKWTRTDLPKEWKEWRKEEKKIQRLNPDLVHQKANKFRRQEWIRRMNGVWICIGNKLGKPVEYVFLTGTMYFYLTWWKQDFGYPKFRFVYLKVFYGFQFAEDHRLVHGVTLSTNRRFGKSAIAYVWEFEYCSRTFNSYGGSQAQTKVDAKKKWESCMMYGWKRVPDFFRPKHDYNVTSELKFTKPLPSGKTVYEDYEVEEGSELGGMMGFRETKSTSYDGEKLHRYILEEPGKWVEEDVYKTLRVVIPCTMEGDVKIGQIFAPTTIEDLEKGGDEFIEMFEDSFPSLMQKNEDGKTTSGLIAIFIPAYEGYIFDEYGRSIVDDPPPGVELFDDKGAILTDGLGAKTKLLKARAKYKGDRQKYTELVRKYPFTWAEAKMMADQESPFNLEILSKRYNALNSMSGNQYIRGNFSWVGEVDGDVEFTRDDMAGRWMLAMTFDHKGGDFENSNGIINRVGEQWQEGAKIFYPKNDRMFAIGSDPIQYTNTDDPRSSKAGAYVFYKFDPAVDSPESPVETWKSHNFIGQYLHRPDEYATYGEDMIMACRYFGCSILAEDNLKSLKQYFEETRKQYAGFLLYRSSFDKTTLMVENKDAWKGVDSNPEVINTYVGRLITFVLRHGHRLLFPELIEQMMKFTIKTRTKFDGVVAAGYTLLASEKIIEDHDPYEKVDVAKYFTLHDQNGVRSKAIGTEEEEMFEEYGEY